MQLGYNELGYNEHSLKVKKIFSPKRLFYYTNHPGYSKTLLKRTNSAGAALFVKNECLTVSKNNWIMPRSTNQKCSCKN